MPPRNLAAATVALYGCRGVSFLFRFTPLCGEARASLYAAPAPHFVRASRSTVRQVCSPPPGSGGACAPEFLEVLEALDVLEGLEGWILWRV